MDGWMESVLSDTLRLKNSLLCLSVRISLSQQMQTVYSSANKEGLYGRLSFSVKAIWGVTQVFQKLLHCV